MFNMKALLDKRTVQDTIGDVGRIDVSKIEKKYFNSILVSFKKALKAFFCNNY